jgi:hypothetical protein
MTPSEKAILETWKRAGGAMKIAAEELEKEIEEEREENGGK